MTDRQDRLGQICIRHRLEEIKRQRRVAQFPACPESHEEAAWLDFERRLRTFHWLADRPLARTESDDEKRKSELARMAGRSVSAGRGRLLADQHHPVCLPIAGDPMTMADAATEEQSNFDAEYPVRLPRWTWR